jgi:hypothetical protein
VGAAILGPGGDEAIRIVLGVMDARSPCTVLQRAVHIDSAVSQLVPTILGAEASGIIVARYGQILENLAGIESLPAGPTRPVSKNRHRASTFVNGSRSLGNIGNTIS